MALFVQAFRREWIFQTQSRGKFSTPGRRCPKTTTKSFQNPIFLLHGLVLLQPVLGKYKNIL